MRNFSVGLTVFLLVLASSAYAQTPSITSVANAATPATAAGAIAPGMLTVINGTNLGDLIHNCLSSGSAPTSCNGTTVLVNGSAAPVVYSSSAAVEFQAPYTLTGSAATLQVTVKTSGGTTLQSNLVNVSVAPTAPALYSKDGTGVGTGYYIDNTSGGFGSVPSGLVLPGDSILLIGNGFGVTNPTVTAGSPAPSPAAAIVASVTLTINGQTVPATATLEPATVTGNSPGFDQVTFTVPSTLTVPAGQSEKDYAMTVTVGGVQSQSVNLRVATPPPTIASISPSPVPLSTTAQTVQVNGTGFQSGLAVHVLGPPGASTLSGSSVTYVSSTQITIQLVTGSTAGTWAMWIVNPDSSQTSSFTFTASGTGPTPTITPCTPFIRGNR